ncbi:MAG: hypothetical protein KAH14_07310, partial [Clostridiales bacterium]|nr:hypothetical protein [Clostridiales bacterium]
MKKVISLLLVFCLIAGFLSGCFAPKVSLEEDLINMQMAGYLYTSSVRASTKEERSFLKEREKAVDTMIEYMEKAAKNAFNLNEGFEKFESNLHNYMEKVDEPSADDSSLLFGILEKITAYEVILKSLEDEISQYMKMKPETAAGKAIINTYMLDAICNIIDNQNEYVSWLVDNTAVVSVILEKENARQAGKLVSSSVT